MLAPLRRSALTAFVALRLVRSRRSRRLSAVTFISILGVAFGVWALTIVLGVTGGFQAAFQERILGLYPHLVVIKRAGDFSEYPELLEEVRGTPGVAAASPATYDDMMVAAGVHRSGAVIKGVELSSVRGVVDLEELVREGSLEGLDETPVVRREGERVVVASVVDGHWMTVAVTDSGLAVAEDDRTPPDAGRVRVRVLDLSGQGGALRLEREEAGEPAPEPGSGEAPPEGALEAGEATAELPDEGEATGEALDAADKNGSRRGKDRSPFPGLLPSHEPEAPDEGVALLAARAPGERADIQELDAGAWRAGADGPLVRLDPDTLVTLVRMPAGAGGAPGLRVLVEDARLPRDDLTAMVRLLDARSSGEALRLAGPDGAPMGPAVEPGEFTGYQPVRARLPGIILGSELARRLHARPGDEVTLVTPLRGIDNKMMGPYGMAPSSVHHVVSGIFESGFYEYDVRLALVNLEAAQRFLNRGPVIRWLEVRTDDLLRVDAVKRRVAALVDPYDIVSLVGQVNGFDEKLARYAKGEVRDSSLSEDGSFVGGLRNVINLVNLVKYQEMDFGYHPRFRLIDWKEMNTNLFRALKLQKVVLTMFFLIIIVVGAFVVVGSQIMVIHEKTPDIAILRAMGATTATIRAIFTLQGLFVAGIGTAVGLVFGVGACALVSAVEYRLDASVYLIDRLPVQLDPLDLVLVAVATAVCTLGATQYSAGRAAAKSVVGGLRAVD
ncbi:MAG: ABC transporter permease [Deltaproteobacteria bacterium]|nr:ABC transporter permease [Deltaproteobacteria bacterium]MCB9787404.1 ABC transporter permease [Deltaproteobacteria bacterium]